MQEVEILGQKLIAEHTIMAQGPKLPDAPPRGYCIYCGKEGSSEVILTREHIIPEGIGGNLVLPEASCDDCQRIIHDFETTIIRGHFGVARFKQGIFSKKRRGRSAPDRNHFSGLKYSGEQQPTERERFTRDEVPNSVILEVFNALPSTLTGAPVVEKPGYRICVSEWSESKFGLGFNSREGDFSRELAKIAAGYAHLHLGHELKGQRSSLVFQGGHERKNMFIGDSPPQYRDALHRVALRVVITREVDNCGRLHVPMMNFVVDIHLFCRLTTPIFHVNMARTEAEEAPQHNVFSLTPMQMNRWPR